MTTFLYTATSPRGLFLGTGVVDADDLGGAFDQVRNLYGVRANIALNEAGGAYDEGDDIDLRDFSEFDETRIEDDPDLYDTSFDHAREENR